MNMPESPNCITKRQIKKCIAQSSKFQLLNGKSLSTPFHKITINYGTVFYAFSISHHYFLFSRYFFQSCNIFHVHYISISSSPLKPLDLTIKKKLCGFFKQFRSLIIIFCLAHIFPELEHLALYITFLFPFLLKSTKFSVYLLLTYFLNSLLLIVFCPFLFSDNCFPQKSFITNNMDKDNPPITHNPQFCSLKQVLN